LIRAPDHPDDVSQYHPAGINVAEPDDRPGGLPLRFDKDANALGEIGGGPRHQGEHHDLGRKHRRYGTMPDRHCFVGGSDRGRQMKTIT
jgi:hypothetical protein